MKPSYKLWFVLTAILLILNSPARARQGSGGAMPGSYGSAEYAAVKKKLIAGWNTWDTRSVLTHVLLPECFAIELQLKDNATGNVLKTALIGRRGKDEGDVRPGLHAYDGSYTELSLKWRGMNVWVQSAAEGGNLFILVTPENKIESGALIVNPEMLYGRKGAVTGDKNVITAELQSKTIHVFADGAIIKDSGGDDTPRIAVSLDGAAGISTGSKKSAGEIRKIVGEAKRKFEKNKEKYGELRDLYNAMQSVLAWNVIYEPANDRVITPVSRAWSVSWGGYVLFCWDTYFASYMLSLDNKELAYANAIEITKEITDSGFVPNFAGADSTSLDRSQPPVGSLAVREIYRHYREKWFLRVVFDDLLRWNRWWEKNRVTDGLLCWGSNPYKGYLRRPSEVLNVNQRMGAALESGLDNSPMYDGMPFNGRTHTMMLADAGLTSMYVMDCEALADIADELGKTDESKELRARAAAYRRNLGGLWDEEKGFYFNKLTRTNEFSYQMSPTNFYPLLAEAPSREQAERMMKEHFYNPSEFWGEWIMPSISRNDPHYKDNEYWRGRIWAPMNFLVYIGLRNYPLADARADLAEKSKRLILKSWLAEGHVYENYNADTGAGDDVDSSDKFYHWGALLAFISFIEKGVVPAPEKPLAEAAGK